MKLHHSLHTHLKQHHKKYLFGIFGSFAIVKMILLFAGFLGIANRVGTFAQTPEVVEVNSGNIVTTYGCALDDGTCDLSDKGITSIAPDTFINHISDFARIDLRDNQLTSIDLEIPTSLHSLLLGGNQISVLPEGIFDNLTGLTSLELRSNQISVLPEGIFDSLSSLTYLYLGDNQISVLPEGIFDSLTNLQGGSIDHNYLDVEAIETDSALVDFLENYLNNGDESWRVQNSSNNLSLTGTITLLAGDSFLLNIEYHNDGPQTLAAGKIYYDMVDGVNVMIDRDYSTGVVGQKYAVTGDPCYDDFYNSGAGAYVDLLNDLIHDQELYDGDALAFIRDPERGVGYTGEAVDAGKFIIDWYTEIWAENMDGPLDRNALVKRLGTDLSSVPGCGVGGRDAYIFDLEHLPAGSGGVITLTGTVSAGHSTFSNDIEILSTQDLWEDVDTGNNTLSLLYDTNNDTITTEDLSFTGENGVSIAISSGTTVIVAGQPWNGTLIPTYSTTYIGLPSNITIQGVVTLDFGGNAIFDKPIKITIPVNGITSTSIQADYGNGPTTDGLTTDPHAICSNGIADPSYNKNLITTIDDTVTIYSCAAFKFIAYTQEDSPSNPGSIGGGSSLSKDICPAQRDCSDSYYDNLCGKCSLIQNKINAVLFHGSANKGPASISGSSFSTELNDAYLRAYDYDITTMPTIQKANMEGKLLRRDMAKMISNFASNVLGRDISTGTTICTFADMTGLSKEAQYYAMSACRLGLMGYASDGVTLNTNFNPDQEVDRAQFGTILSRLLRGNENNIDKPYYLKHLQALKAEGIMTKTDTPSQKELRGWVMLMMMRAGK